KLTNGTSGAGSAAAASSAAILGPAAAASFDQPAVSRILANLMAALSPAASENSGASCVQPTTSGAPAAAAARNFSSSARQSWRAVSTCAPRQARFTLAPSGAIVSSHEPTMKVGGGSAFRPRVLRRLPTQRRVLAAALSTL